MIALANATEMQTSLSITNGPRGYLSQVGTNVVYTGYDGKEIWKTEWTYNSKDKLISSYYDKDYFICLIGDNDAGGANIVTYKEEDGIENAFDILFEPNYNELYYNIEQAKRTLLIPIQGSDSQYLITFQTTNGPTTGTVGRVDRNYWIVQLQADGSITKLADSTIEDIGWIRSFLAAGAITYNGKDYLIALTQHADGGDSIYLDVYTKSANSSSVFVYPGSDLITIIAPTDINDVIINNIPQIYLSLNASNNIDITAILNYDTAKTQIISNEYNTSTDSLVKRSSIINLEQPTGLKLNYDIYKGRIYGDYLYAYLGIAEHGGVSHSRKIMRLKLTDHNDGTWNDIGLQWDGSYTNPRIVLYDYIGGTPTADFAIAQPFYQADNNYSQYPNIYTLYNASVNLRYLDGTKPAYAYETKLKTTSNEFKIANVGGTLVKDANPDLKTYFSNQMLVDSFTQYQTGTSYSITQKTDATSVNENAKGNIPATITIDKAYDNNSFAPVAKSFDIVLSGFMVATTSLQATTASINLPDLYPYQIEDLNSNEPIKQFIYKNVITGLKDSIDPNVDISFTPSNVTYDNKDGSILLTTITLKNYYDEQGVIQTTPKTFALANSDLIKISGFKKVAGPTAGKQTSINVTGDLTTMNTTEVTEAKLTEWINTNIDLILDNPTPNTTVEISNLQANSSIGTIYLSLTPSSYFINDAHYSYTINPSITFNNITLTGFTLLDQTTKVVANDANIANVSGTLADLLPQAINLSNDDFKKYLIENIVIDPSNRLNPVVTDFSGNYDNTTGTYTLTSLTLAKTLDANGSVIDAIPGTPTFNNLSIPIKGFKAIVATAVNNPLKIAAFANTSILDATNEIIKTWLDTNFTQAFIANSLPTNFTKDNLVSVNIIQDSIVASTGTLNVNLVINNYYANDNIGTLTTTNSNPFELTITGFKTDSLATSVNTDPTAIELFPNAANNLAENVDFTNDQIGFKDYLIQHVIIDPSHTLDVTNITNISNVVANNITGTLSFQLEVNKRTDQDGNVIDGTYTFNEVITIKGFKQISPTTAITTPLAKGDSTVLANDVTQDQYTKVISDNYQTIFTNLPDGFNPNTNIVNVNKTSVDNEQGILEVNVNINLYYIETTGLITSAPNKSFTITISGYKSSLININNRVDIINVGDDAYRNQIAAAALIDTTNTNLQIATNWLRTDAIFTKVIADPKGLAKTAFSVSTINTSDNIGGQITVTLAVTGGNFAPNHNQLTFFGFRKTININQWTDQVKNMIGNATTPTDKISDIKKQIVEASKNSDAPFNQPLTEKDIQVIDLGNNNFDITITPSINNGYVNASGDYENNSAPIIINGLSYKTNVPANSQSGLADWVYPVIFSIVGVVVFLILLWIIIAIIRRNKKQVDLTDDYGMVI